MPTSRHFHAKAWLTAAASLVAAQAYANQLVYVPLAQPCRLLDTRTSTGGSGPLAQSHGAYLFGTSTADISSSTQHGSATGCGIPTEVAAVSVNMNLLSATAAGNIVTWSADAGGTAPNIGTAVYNPTVGSPAPGQVQYNTGYTSVPVGRPATVDAGRFYLQVANGQIDMTINVVGYWLPVSWNETRSGDRSVTFGAHTTATNSNAMSIGLDTTASGVASLAMGYLTTASGEASTALGNQTTASSDASTSMGSETKANGKFSTAMGLKTTASGDESTAIGSGTIAHGYQSTAMGRNTTANGDHSTAMGDSTVAEGNTSTAMGSLTKANGSGSTAMGISTVADGFSSTAMGNNVGNGGNAGSFIYGDASARSQAFNTAPNQFVGVATGGVYFFTGCAATCTTGVGLPPGGGSWFTLSDRNAKTAVHPVDPHEVLKKVTSLPLNTWQYKTQDAKYRHMGPMAQDFYAAFQLGESDKGIDTVDADGVALAAIQGLNALLTEKDEKTAARLEEKDREIASLRAELSAQKNRVAALESLAEDMTELKTQLVTLRRLVPTEVAVVQQQP